MWLKTRKLNALLAPLAPLVDGQTSDGAIKGAYRGYEVEARPHSGYPIDVSFSTMQGAAPNPAPVNMFQVALAGAAGSRPWDCQSSASSFMQDQASLITAGPLLKLFKPGEFKFDVVDWNRDSAGRTWAAALKPFMPGNNDPEAAALRERLIAAGLFAELDALRFGAHPYLPKVMFIPGRRAMFELQPLLGTGRALVEERLRAAGLDYESVMKKRLEEAEAKFPGRLRLDVEAGEATVLSPEQFRELLEHAIVIADINARVNTSGSQS
jgi:hypothetical protein